MALNASRVLAGAAPGTSGGDPAANAGPAGSAPKGLTGKSADCVTGDPLECAHSAPLFPFCPCNPPPFDESRAEAHERRDAQLAFLDAIQRSILESRIASGSAPESSTWA